MSVRKLTASLLTALAMLGGVASVNAQEYVPVADPFAFDPDFRWFEPVYDMDLADMKPKKRAATGWFATYDRLNLYGSRPELDEPGVSETKLDKGYGHRYEIGYMLPDEDSGWLFNWTENQVQQSFTVRQEALNRYNGDQVIGGSGGGSATDPIFGFITPPGEANNLGYFYRFYDIQDTENVFQYDSYELNKTWRLEPYHYGGILEPMVGVRWMRINDVNAFQTLDVVPVAFTPDPEGVAENFHTDAQLTENELIGGQLGFRYFKFRDRFTFSTDFRAFFGGAYQCSEAVSSDVLTIYETTGNTVTIGDPPEFIEVTKTKPIYTRNEEFFVGFDVRGEVGYQLTKMLTVRTGFQVIDIARGVWRGGTGQVLNSVGDRDQDLVMVGATFGLTLNR